MELNTGKKIFKSVPDELTPIWSGEILRLFDQHIENVPKEVSCLYAQIHDYTLWKNAHGQFTAIRIFHLNNPDFKPDGYLSLAEKVAKVIYNASVDPAPFDTDSGCHISRLAIEVAKNLNSKELSDKLERLLLLFVDKTHLKRIRNHELAKELLLKLID